jgi:pyridoxine/pyridoxamine 5'-phosphate oxidase
MNATPDSLDAAWDLAWARLFAGARGRHDPYHQGVLATLADDGPQARYAVLRAVDAQSSTVAFHTDRRSPKCAQLLAEPRVAWCFFGHGEQLRLQGRVSLHLDDDAADRAWAACRTQARATYTVPLAPGTPLDLPPDGGRAGPPDSTLLSAARGHFALAQVQVEHVDWLSLAASGHRRASFRRHGARWDAQWLSP